MKKPRGRFQSKKEFTIADIGMLQAKPLSLEAMGLYVTILSFVTAKDVNNASITKKFLMKECCDGKEIFNLAWNELLEKGYLKIHMSSVGEIEYELIVIPELSLIHI